MDAKQRLAALSDEERQLLIRRLTAGKGQHAGRTIRRRPAGSDGVPLSFAQQRIWFLNQLGPLNLAFNVGRPTRFGAVQIDALERALNEVVRRHDSLRTSFAVVDGVPVQRVAPFAPFALPVTDLRHLPEAERHAVGRRQADEEQRRPWTLDTGPVFRARLWRFAEDDHLLLFVMHHVVSDGWSWGVLVRELKTLYQAFKAGRPSPLAELPIQYPDYSAWQRDWVEGADCGRQLAYWRDRHADLPQTRFVPDRRDAGASDVGIHKWAVLSRELTRDVKALCQREGATLFMTLVAAFATLLSRYTGQTAVVIGSPIANRNRAEVEDLIGCFMNPLPLRVDLGGNPRFRELLQRVRDLSLSVYSNQDVPFDLLVKTLQPKRDPSNTPLFQVMLLLQNFPWQPFDLSASDDGGSAVTEELLRELEGITEQSELVYPVALEAFEAGPFLAGCFQYAPQYGTTFSRVADHFRTLLQAVVADPEARVGEIPLLSDAERGQMLGDWSGGLVAAPTAPLIHSAFERAAARWPEAPAVVSADGEVSYQRLNEDANRLARHLRALGAGPGRFVGLLLHRSTDLVTALMAVLKTGAAYVPLDPAYPASRLAFVARDAAMPLLITTRPLLDGLPELEPSLSAARVVCLDDDAAAIAGQDPVNPGWDVSPADVAYVIYTSGSTGVPKGVPIQHRAIANYVEAAAAAFAVTPADRVLQFASISFDTAAEEIYPCLARGAALVLRSDGMIASAPEFLRECHKHAISILDLPTAYWHELAQQMAQHDLPLPEAIRLVILGGEQARPDRVRAWQARFGSRARLLNTYGPTEATVVATAYEVPPVEADMPGGEVPIGRPVPGARTYVLDRRGLPVPVGIPGELHLGGVGVAVGYLNRPDLTAEKFVPDPFGGEPGGRLYRTGDLVRYLGDGTIEFLGRADTQVKLRGYRIELSEIEAAVSRHPGVHASAVVVRQDDGEPQLVAYVVAAPTVAPADLRRALRASLPDYMVPAAFVRLEALPLTPNGKVDRDGLPRPAGERHVEEAFVAPATAMEQRLARHWQDVLRLGAVGVDDNFFDLGGHSLLVVQLHSRLRADLGEDLAVLDLFRYPTVRAMARHLTKEPAREASEPALAAIHDRASRQRQAFRQRRLAAVPSGESR